MQAKTWGDDDMSGKVCPLVKKILYCSVQRGGDGDTSYGKSLHLPLNAVKTIPRASVDLLAIKEWHSNGAGQTCPPKLENARYYCYSQAWARSLYRAPRERESFAGEWPGRCYIPQDANWLSVPKVTTLTFSSPLIFAELCWPNSTWVIRDLGNDREG